MGVVLGVSRPVLCGSVGLLSLEDYVSLTDLTGDSKLTSSDGFSSLGLSISISRVIRPHFFIFSSLSPSLEEDCSTIELGLNYFISSKSVCVVAIFSLLILFPSCNRLV